MRDRERAIFHGRAKLSFSKGLRSVNYNKEARKRRIVEHSSSENGAARIVSVNRKAKLAKIRF